MPRKTAKMSAPHGYSSPCFNEAAARCRGKPLRNNDDFPEWAALQ